MNATSPIIPTRGPIGGLARLSRAMFEGRLSPPVWAELHQRITANAEDADALYDASLMLRLAGAEEAAQTYLRAALDRSACYTVRHGRGDRLTLLVFQTGLDAMSNAPIDLVLDGSDLTVLYFHLDSGVATELPDHDVAFLAMGESEAHRSILAEIEGVLSHWPVSVMNADGRRIAAMTRDQVSAALADVPEIHCPPTTRLDRSQLTAAASRDRGAPLLNGPGVPFTIRPMDSECGKGLERIDSNEHLDGYLDRHPQEAFFVAPFIDYSGADGRFRKQRIAFIDGRPYPVHLAISSHWMVHYFNAGMSDCAIKRAEEARWMDTFHMEYAVRHECALAAIQARIGTDYYAIDCAEAPDGRLVFFEADVASVIHALDPVDLFPYKRAHMARLRDAFIAALERRMGACADQLTAA